jgi:hypothetical protein
MILCSRFDYPISSIIVSLTIGLVGYLKVRWLEVRFTRGFIVQQLFLRKSILIRKTLVIVVAKRIAIPVLLNILTEAKVVPP